MDSELIINLYNDRLITPGSRPKLLASSWPMTERLNLPRPRKTVKYYAIDVNGITYGKANNVEAAKRLAALLHGEIRSVWLDEEAMQAETRRLKPEIQYQRGY